ncbi:MAG TPA: PhnD/SsuA/transferrin family substrate-binding protein [Kineosporiaceae bacterium]|nr:PhnD/SsuA/transferrin family substrate-binding protein [Kineosporiaceae bacterium]
MDVFEVLSTQLRRMSVCPHDTARNVYGWFFLNSYLQSQLSCRLHFEAQENFLAERSAVLAGGYDLVYANPYSAVLFARQQGFVPVAKPVGIHDETYLVARPDWTPPQPGQKVTVASATDKLIVHTLGVTLLPQLGLDESMIDYRFTGNHLAAAKAVMDGAAELGFVFNETWEGMSDFSRSGLQILHRTDRRLAFHCFMVGPQFQDRTEDIRAVLTSMTRRPEAADILQELSFPNGLEQAGLADLNALSAIVPSEVG